MNEPTVGEVVDYLQEVAPAWVPIGDGLIARYEGGISLIGDGLIVRYEGGISLADWQLPDKE